MEISVVGIDLAKEVFQMHAVDEKGRQIFSKKVARAKLMNEIARLPRCLIGMEACGGAHFWARAFRELGHEVRLVAPQFVKPFVKSNKNDALDAEAICEAVTRPSMRFVPIKAVAQQDLQSLHRVRARLVKSKTALANEIRGLLLEYGIPIRRGISQLRTELPKIIASTCDGSRLTSLSGELFSTLLDEFESISERLERFDEKILAIHRAHPVSQRLGKIPGVGPLTATAMLAAVSDVNAFRNGREFSAWLGLVPRQSSSGGRDLLLGISKRGDVYIRTLLIHGARCAIRWAHDKKDPRSLWVKSVLERRGANRASVALANKNARTIWALMKHDREYDMSWLAA